MGKERKGEVEMNIWTVKSKVEVCEALGVCSRGGHLLLIFKPGCFAGLKRVLWPMHENGQLVVAWREEIRGIDERQSWASNLQRAIEIRPTPSLDTDQFALRIFPHLDSIEVISGSGSQVQRLLLGEKVDLDELQAESDPDCQQALLAYDGRPSGDLGPRASLIYFAIVHQRERVAV